jgi:DNA-binding winged helix-turn-helix (wHTH) protein
MVIMLRTWKIELTLDELATVEFALVRVATDEVAAWLGRPPADAGKVVSSLLNKTAAVVGWGKNLEGHQAVVLDEGSYTVTILGERFACKPTSFRLLSHLIQRQGSWVRSESLQRDVLQTSVHDGASNIRWHVLQARRALGLRGELIHSDHQLGFMFDLAPCDRRHCTMRRPQPNDAADSRTTR